MKRQNTIAATIKEITGYKAHHRTGPYGNWYYVEDSSTNDWLRGYTAINELIEKFKTSGILDVYKLDKDVTYSPGNTGHKSAYMFVVRSKSNKIMGSFIINEPGFVKFGGTITLETSYHDEEKLESMLKEFREEGTVVKL